MPTGMLPPSGFWCFVPRKTVVPVRMTVRTPPRSSSRAGMINPETQARLRSLAEKPTGGQGRLGWSVRRSADVRRGDRCCVTKVSR